MNIAAVPAFAGGVLEGVACALQVAPPSEWPAELGEQATQSARVTADGLHALRLELEAALRGGGAPGHVMLARCTQLLTITDKFGAAADQVRQAETASVALPPGADDFLAALRGLLDEWDALRCLVAPIVAKLKAPPIDAARLEAGREAIRKGDFRVYSDADDMARDLAGD